MTKGIVISVMRLVIYVGLMGLLTAYAHVFRPVQTSASIGWSEDARVVRGVIAVENHLPDVPYCVSQ
jgi:hypothetical protein